MTTPTTVQVQIQLRADTAANWTSEDPVLLAAEVGLETDTKKLKVGDGTTAWTSLAYFPSIVTGGTVLGNLEIGTTGTLTFEGSTADGFETTLAVTDPTADRTITLPDQSGTVVVSSNLSRVYFGSGEVVFNETGEDYNFRIEGDTEPNLVFVDASTNRVGLGTSEPATLLHLSSATGAATPVPTELRIASTTVSSSWSTTDPWGRISFYAEDPTSGGPKIHGAIDCVAFSAPLGSSHLVFKTTSNSTDTLSEAMRITHEGNVGIGNNGAGGYDVLFNSGSSSSPLVRDTSGRLLVGTSNAVVAGSLTPRMQLEGAGPSDSSFSLRRCSANSGGPNLYLSKSRGATVGSYDAVQDDDTLGAIIWVGANGVNSSNVAANILAQVDGEPFSGGDTTDLPGRIVFSTTPDGASGPTPRMTIKSSGIINISNASTYADNTAALADGLIAGDIYRKSDGTLMITY